MPRSVHLALAVALGSLALTSGCKPKDISLTATGKIVQEGGKDVLLVDVVTEPRVEVRANDSSYAQTFRATADENGKATVRVVLPDPTPPPKPNAGTGLLGSSSGSHGLYGSSGSTYGSSGSAYGSSGLYGSSGSTYGSSGSSSSHALMGPEIRLTLNVEQYQPRTVGRARYRHGTTSVVVQRPAAIRYDTVTRAITCVGKPCAGTVSVASTIRADFSDVEPSTIVDLGGARARTVTRTLAVSVDAAKYLDKVPLADIFQEYPVSSVDIPLRIEPGGGPALETKVNLPANQLRPALTAALAQVAKGGVRFPDEPAAAGGPPRALFYTTRAQLVGEAKQAHEIDLVAVRTDRDRPGCTDGASDAVLTVYERRTGKVVSTKAFTAGMCSLDYDEKAIDDHVHTFVK